MGRSLSKDSIGDRSVTHIINKCLHLDCYPVLREIKKLQVFEGSFSISTADFNKFYAKIAKKTKPIEIPIIDESFCWKKQEFVRDDFVKISNEVIQWAKKQNVEAGLLTLRALPTSAVGSLPLRHLTALALAKDLVKLNYYLECFKKGDRLGFVPYITQEYIERAIKCVS